MKALVLANGLSIPRPANPLKACRECKRERPVQEFRARRRISGTVREICLVCSEKRRNYSKKWAATHRSQYARNQREWKRKIREAALRHYSGGTPLCACCGETMLDFLTLDHVGGGGVKHRRALAEEGQGSGTAIYSVLKKLGYPSGYQVLCCNCNWAKGRRGQCPHKTKKDRRSHWAVKVTADTRFGAWPFVSETCRIEMRQLLVRGGSLSAYRANPNWPLGPVEDSWAWRLERLLEQLFGIANVAVCMNGTMALMAALYAAQLEPGEIITSPFSFSATPAAIRLTGHEPVFADIDPVTFCLDPIRVQQMITPRTRAILPVDLFGRLANYGALTCLGLPIIEDASQAVGAMHGGKFAGSFGLVAAVSFNGAKNVPAGEAGAVLTNNHAIAERVRLFLNHGENFGAVDVGMNGRLNEPTALVAFHGAQEVLARNEKRRELAQILIEELSGVPGIRGFPDLSGHALYVFPLVLDKTVNRAAFAERLRKVGVEIGQGYITPTLSAYMAFEKCRRSALPVAEELSGQTLCLLTQVRPPALERDMRWLAGCIRAALGKK